MKYERMTEILTDCLNDHGGAVREWPEDEKEAYRDTKHQSFDEARNAVLEVRLRNAIDGLTPLFADAWDEGRQAGHDHMIGKQGTNPYREEAKRDPA